MWLFTHQRCSAVPVRSSAGLGASRVKTAYSCSPALRSAERTHAGTGPRIASVVAFVHARGNPQQRARARDSSGTNRPTRGMLINPLQSAAREQSRCLQGMSAKRPRRRPNRGLTALQTRRIWASVSKERPFPAGAPERQHSALLVPEDDRRRLRRRFQPDHRGLTDHDSTHIRHGRVDHLRPRRVTPRPRTSRHRTLSAALAESDLYDQGSAAISASFGVSLGVNPPHCAST